MCIKSSYRRGDYYQKLISSCSTRLFFLFWNSNYHHILLHIFDLHSSGRIYCHIFSRNSFVHNRHNYLCIPLSRPLCNTCVPYRI